MFKIAQDCVDFNDINLTDVGAYEEFVSYRHKHGKRVTAEPDLSRFMPTTSFHNSPCIGRESS